MTGREAEVLALLGEHLSHAEIAGRLFISIRTVETQISKALKILRTNLSDFLVTFLLLILAP